jgi:hypothetical protein
MMIEIIIIVEMIIHYHYFIADPSFVIGRYQCST